MLNSARRWSNFLAILGFIGSGLLVLLALFMGTFLSFLGDETMPSGVVLGISLLYLALGIVYFFPVYYLFKFSDFAGKAVKSGSSENLTAAIKNLKAHYKFIGITAIVTMILYPLIIVIIVAATAFSG
jgi:membrane-anchored glycerophosphoryl diester phosphodiesterase (GDPDase)